MSECEHLYTGTFICSNCEHTIYPEEIDALLADRDALVRYVRLLDGCGPYGNPEFVVELEEVRQALSQELRDLIGC